MKIIKYTISILIIILGWAVPIGFIVDDYRHPTVQFGLAFFFIAFFALLFLIKASISFEKWFESKLIENQNTL